MQSYHDYASFCQAKHDVYSVLSTEGGLIVNISHIVYTCVIVAAGRGRGGAITGLSCAFSCLPCSRTSTDGTEGVG